MMKLLSITKLAYLLPFTALTQVHAQADYAQYVNPMIGTGGHGHTFPGATVPFGMVQLSPDTRIDGSWDGCSGYHYSDAFIYGFSHTHLSGTGCSDYGDIAVLPQNDKAYNKYYAAKMPPPSPNSNFPGKKEKFSHANEKASAGYYEVTMDNGIHTELTTTTRCGMHKYEWPANTPRVLIIKLDHRDKTLESDIDFKDKHVLEGYRISEAWARAQHIYFSFEFSEEYEVIESTGTNWEDAKGNKGTHVPYAVIKFKKQKSSAPLFVKVGISNVSVEGAHNNREIELPNWNFEQVKAQAAATWNKELAKIEVTSTDKDQLNVFYTALYHCMIHPSTASDNDGKYRGRDNQVHTASGFTYYTVFSLWDTFRGLHPLMAIIDQKRTNDFIKTFLAQYEQGKLLPVWELSSNETWCMIGYHSVSVIADAYMKGIRDFDANLALEAMQKSANSGYFGLGAYTKKRFMEVEDEHESVSKTLEYAYDDWCIAQLANALDKPDVYEQYKLRSKGWLNLFDPQTGFIRPRTNGSWLTPFDPREVNNNYTEANGWQYTFFVPHDISSLMDAMGGKDKFTAKLDELFSAGTQTTGREQVDISGLIGQYAHGNEPSHHMAYLYTYAGQPWKTQKLIHQVVNDFYKNSPDGLIGNEDCGQMSAWYVLSALGFYPVCPGTLNYALGTPAFEKSVVHLENGQSFTVQAKNFSSSSFYLQDVKKYYVEHKDIMAGGELVLNMGAQPQTELSKNTAFPETNVNGFYFTAPLISGAAKTFHDTMTVSISGTKDTRIFYEINYDSASVNQKTKGEYAKAFTINRSATINAYQLDGTGAISAVSYASFHKIPHKWTVKIASEYNPQYTAGGAEGIIDGLHGDVHWRKGGWQGYQAQNFECVIDLVALQPVSAISASFLQDQRAWIIMPSSVVYAYSTDGKKWLPYQTVKNTVDAKDETVQVKSFKATGKAPVKARYIKVKAINYGKLPAWHQGAGGDAFIFVDEIEVN